MTITLLPSTIAGLKEAIYGLPNESGTYEVEENQGQDIVVTAKFDMTMYRDLHDDEDATIELLDITAINSETNETTYKIDFRSAYNQLSTL